MQRYGHLSGTENHIPLTCRVVECGANVRFRTAKGMGRLCAVTRKLHEHLHAATSMGKVNPEIMHVEP